MTWTTGGEVMSSLVEIKDSQSERLQRIASETGVTSNVLLEEALELLFQQADRLKSRQEELDFLRQLETEDDGSLQIRARSPFNIDEVTITHAVPVDPASVRRL